MLDEQEYRRWREQADRALVSARASMAAGQHEWACFLAEQSAQLAVKGFLHGAGRQAWGHDLIRLEAAAREAAAQAWSADTGDAAARLSRHYIPTRYPDAHASGTPGEHYRNGDAQTAVADAESVLGAVDGSWDELGRSTGP